MQVFGDEFKSRNDSGCDEGTHHGMKRHQDNGDSFLDSLSSEALERRLSLPAMASSCMDRLDPQKEQGRAQ